MFSGAIKTLGYYLAPELTKNVATFVALTRKAKELRKRVAGAHTVAEKVEAVWNGEYFAPSQVKTEILDLLAHIQQQPPACLAEIGTDRGGTLVLFASVATENARLISLDYSYPDRRRRVLRHLVKPRQELTCLEADSHASETFLAVKRLLKGDMLDFLFIDGDHSYQGVKQDYEMYAPLVRPGGMIAFHDIVPDFRTRFGVQTSASTGGVPTYWSELKTQVARDNVRELIADPEQDGYGVGIIVKNSTCASPVFSG